MTSLVSLSNRPPRFRARRARAAVSLTELLISIALSGVVIAAAGTVLMQSLSNDQVFRRQMSARQNARTAVDTVADDLKGALRLTSLVTVDGQQRALPTETVTNTLAANATASIDDYTNPLTFDVYTDARALRRVRYWRRFNSTLQVYELRREIVSDSINASTGARTAPESASAVNAGQVIARNVTRFTATKQALGGADTYDMVRVIIEVTESPGIATVQATVTLRNNALSTL